MPFPFTTHIKVWEPHLKHGVRSVRRPDDVGLAQAVGVAGRVARAGEAAGPLIVLHKVDGGAVQGRVLGGRDLLGAARTIVHRGVLTSKGICQATLRTSSRAPSNLCFPLHFYTTATLSRGAGGAGGVQEGAVLSGDAVLSVAVVGPPAAIIVAGAVPSATL